MAYKDVAIFDKYSARQEAEIELMNACLERGDGEGGDYRHITPAQEKAWYDLCETVTGNQKQRQQEWQRERTARAKRDRTPGDAI